MNQIYWYYVKKMKITILNAKKSNLVKHACQNMVIMETSRLMEKGN